MQIVLNAYFAIGNAAIANVETMQTEVAHTFNIATAWIDLYTSEDQCFKIRA